MSEMLFYHCDPTTKWQKYLLNEYKVSWLMVKHFGYLEEPYDMFEEREKNIDV